MIRDHGDELRDAYNARYSDKYGHYRPEIDRELEKYLRCGIARFGFARIKCTNAKCGETYVLPFSCKTRGLCPSCLQKNMLQTEMWVVDNILKEVPHRHLVFTIPKLLRRPFFHSRGALNELSRIAWKCVKAFMIDGAGLGTPAAVQAIETSGEYLEPNPHIHVIATDGVFTEQGNFCLAPKFDEWAHRYLLSLWTKAISSFVVKHKFITSEMMGKILNWQHTGFSVFADRRVDFKKSDEASIVEMRHLARYISKPPFSLEKILWKPGSDKVIYRGTGLQKWHKQNFETYDVLDFLAALTSHIPNHRQKYVGYYGEYSNKTRGMQKIGVGESRTGTEAGASVEQAKFRQSWAMLIQKVWEVNPLECPKCGSLMKIIAIIEDKGLVEATLCSLGLWRDLAPRGPPIDLTPPPGLVVRFAHCSALQPEIEREPWNEDLGVD